MKSHLISKANEIIELDKVILDKLIFLKEVIDCSEIANQSSILDIVNSIESKTEMGIKRELETVTQIKASEYIINSSPSIKELNKLIEDRRKEIDTIQFFINELSINY